MVIFIFIYRHSTYCLARSLAQCVCILEHPNAHVPLLQGHPGWRNYQHLRVQATVHDSQVQHPKGYQERHLLEVLCEVSTILSALRKKEKLLAEGKK